MPLAVNKEASLLESKILSPLHGIRADTCMKKARWSDCPSQRTSCVYSSQVSVLAPWLYFSINSSLCWITAHRHSACSWRIWSGSHSEQSREDPHVVGRSTPFPSRPSWKLLCFIKEAVASCQQILVNDPLLVLQIWGRSVFYFSRS